MRLVKKVAVFIVACALTVTYFGVPSAVSALIPTAAQRQTGNTAPELIDRSSATKRTVGTHRVGEVCGIALSGWEARDVDTGLTLRCAPSAALVDGYRWKLSDDASQTTPDPQSRGSSPYTPGKTCTIRYTTVASAFDMMSPSTGERLRCTSTPQPDGTSRSIWVVVPDPGPTPPSTLPFPTRDPASRDPASTVSGENVCTQTQFLPDGFVLPPGAAVIVGSPDAFESDEPSVKDFRCRTEALLPATTDPEAINTFMVSQCEANGWLHNPNDVGRYTVSPKNRPRNATPFGPGDMLMGSCRTKYGSYTLVEGQPWHVNWSVTTYNTKAVNTDPDLAYAIGKSAELMIEVRAFAP